MTELGNGVTYLLRKNKVTRLQGRGRLLARDRVEVSAADQTFEVQARKAIVVATGSEAATLPHLPIDEQRIVTSTGALSLTAVPRHLAVIGGGYDKDREALARRHGILHHSAQQIWRERGLG